MLGHGAALRVEDEGGVVDLTVRQLRHGAAHQIDAQLLCQRRQRLLRLTTHRLTVAAKTPVVIGAAEHLRQDRHVDGLLRRLAYQLTGAADILALVVTHMHLDLRDLHLLRLLAPSIVREIRCTFKGFIV